MIFEATEKHKIKDGIRREWADGAPVWRKWNAQYVVQTRAATETAVKAARLRRGMRVLDLASGTGEPALAMAAHVGRHGHVTATDLVPEMLAVAAERAKQLDLANMSFQQADAEHLGFDDESFDVVTCRFGITYFLDVENVLEATHRVLEPGGRAVFVTWGPIGQNPYFTTTLGVLMKYVLVPPPDPRGPHPFRFGQAGVNFGEFGTISGALLEAGFRDVKEECLTVPWPWPGPVEQAWEFFRETAPYRGLIDGIAEGQREQAFREVLADMGQYYDGRQVYFPAVILLATATR